MTWVLESDDRFPDAEETTDPADNDDNPPGEYTMNVSVVPNTGQLDTTVQDTIAEAIAYAYYPVYENSTNQDNKWAPDELNVRYWEDSSGEYPNILCDDSQVDILVEFESWLKNHSVSNSDVGAYLLVQDCGNNQADPGSGGYSAFNSLKRAVCSVSSSTARTKNQAVHEVSHTFIDDDLEEVQNMLGSTTLDEPEHALGWIYPYSWYVDGGKHSPMMGRYGCEAAARGDCSSSTCDTGEFTENITECTANAIGYTARAHL